MKHDNENDPIYPYSTDKSKKLDRLFMISMGFIIFVEVLSIVI